jgi:serine/threonine protein kinase
LQGLKLAGGWHVVERMTRPPGATGGYFSESYVVKRDDGVTAFLKAFDYSGALEQPDAASALQALTGAYLFERDLLIHCAEQRLSRVVLALGHGEVNVPGYEPLARVNYLIFERAECDIRRYRDSLDRLDVAWALRSLHHAATGMRQLHSCGVVHQDLKPSNVLVFSSTSSKIGDLGRASRQGYIAPHEDYVIAGDLTYAPPELLYGQYDPDTMMRRRACDVYHLGSLLSFFFTGVGTTSALAAELDPGHQWGNWTGSFSEVLPYVRDAFDRFLASLAEQLPGEFASSLLVAFQQLCDPDPAQRGDPRARIGNGNPYALERYVSRFDLLARRAELTLTHSLK